MTTRTKVFTSETIKQIAVGASGAVYDIGEITARLADDARDVSIEHDGTIINGKVRRSSYEVRYWVPIDSLMFMSSGYMYLTVSQRFEIVEDPEGLRCYTIASDSKSHDISPLKVRFSAASLLADHIDADIRDFIAVLRSHRLEGGDHVFTVEGRDYRVDLVTNTVVAGGAA